MNITLSPDVALRLETAKAQARGLEVSGLGFVERRPDTLYVYDITIFDIGSTGYTEFEAEKILPLTQREDAKNLKLWWHIHPVGNGVPGKHNWSGTDEHTATKEPLGSIPELVGWSCAIVRTPNGWVGRIDNHKTKKTIHVPVIGQAEDVLKVMAELHELRPVIVGTPANGSPLSDDPDWIAYDDFDRGMYDSDEEYLASLCLYYDCDIDELEIDRIGNVWFGKLKIGAGVDPDFGFYDEEIDVSISKDPVGGSLIRKLWPWRDR